MCGGVCESFLHARMCSVLVGGSRHFLVVFATVGLTGERGPGTQETSHLKLHSLPRHPVAACSTARDEGRTSPPLTPPSTPLPQLHI